MVTLGIVCGFAAVFNLWLCCGLVTTVRRWITKPPEDEPESSFAVHTPRDPLYRDSRIPWQEGWP